MSSGDRPAYDHTAATTGILMSGKISVGVRTTASPPNMTIRIARTINVYGRRSARRTTASMSAGTCVVQRQAGRREGENRHQYTDELILNLDRGAARLQGSRRIDQRGHYSASIPVGHRNSARAGIARHW